MKKLGKVLIMSLVYWAIAAFLAGLVVLLAVGDCGATSTIADGALCLRQQRSLSLILLVIALPGWPLFIKLVWCRFPGG